jgi:hypothetical protein
MILFFTPLHIITAAVLGFFVGSLWYSPFLFFKAWLKGEGVTLDQVPRHTKRYMFSVHAYSLIAHGVMATVLALIFDLLSVRTAMLAVSLGLLFAFGFIITTRFLDMVYSVKTKHYEMQSQTKFLVSSGYYLLIMSVMSLVLYSITVL